MAEPAEPRIVAEIGGLAVVEQGSLVTIVDRGTGALATAAFVLTVVAVDFGGFGAVTLALTATNGTTLPRWLSTILLLVGVAVAGAVFGLVRQIRGATAKPVSGYRHVAIFDRGHRVFVDADGVVVAPLDQVRLDTRTQLASSSPMLVAVTPAGGRIHKRGNPFNGGLGHLEAVLTAVEFAPPR